jgi:hypothetical protein
MRAATAIVGAIAVASVLIALALIFSGGGSGGTVTTRTVVEVVRPPAQEIGAAQFGGPSKCGKELSVENVSCEVGTQIHEDYVEGGRGELFAEDKEADESITMSCQESAPVECSGPGGAKVYFGE